MTGGASKLSFRAKPRNLDATGKGESMRRNLIAVCALVGVSAAAFLAVTVLGIVWKNAVMIAVGAAMTLFALWVTAGSVYRERIYETFEKKFGARDYAGALETLDKAAANHFFFPMYRTVAYQLYIRGELAVDNLAEAAKYVDLLRHSGGDGWKYRTAFYVVLFNLDWGEYALAREEFDAFEKACAHSSLYKEQLETLRALLGRINGGDEPLPESVKKSPYPVVGRIVERCA